jgi:molybdate transport system substrate-binding protein
MQRFASLIGGALTLAAWVAPVGATELVVYSSTGMQAALTDIKPIYERKTQNKLTITFATANQVKDKIGEGAEFDVAVVLPPVTDQLISTPDGFKTALLGAKRVAFTTTGQSGIYLAKLLDQWGITDQIKAKAIAIPSGPTAEYVAKGEADMAIQLLAELHAVPGVQVVPFPAAVQNYLKFQGGINPTSKHKEADAAFLKFLSTPAVAKVLRAKFMEPGN